MSSISRCKRLMNMTFAKIINMVPISGELRYRLIRYSGVKTLGKRGFIGKNVSFDSIRPDLIEIEDGAYVTEACIVYTHYLIPDTFVTRKGSWFRFGRVVIKKNAFVGARTIICRAPLKITPKLPFTNKLTFTIFSLVTKRGFLYGPAQLFRPERQT